MEKSALILDLDNTVYNWMDVYAQCLVTQVDYLVKNTGLAKSTIMQSFKQVFIKYCSVEIPHAVYELSIWRNESLINKDFSIIQNESFRIFLRKWESTIRLFPYVKETLEWATSQGILIFGYSDAFSYWIDFRLKALSVLDFFEKVYAANNDKIFSPIVKKDNMDGRVIQLEPEYNKPSSKIFDYIAAEFNIHKKNIYMLGDSLEKDVLPAQKAGVVDIWAKYGTRHGTESRAVLSRITPWDRSERSFHQGKVKPTYTITDFIDIKQIICH